MHLCLIAGLVTVALGQSATVSWHHSVEKILWEEDYRVSGRHLILEEARIRGTGAGMDIPKDAVFKGGSWHYYPRLSHLKEVRLSHSPFTAPYTLCAKGKCQTLPQWMPDLAPIETVILKTCPEEKNQ